MTEYPDYGCWTWFAPNPLADEWLSKIKLVKTTWNNWLAYRIDGLPCWRYTYDRTMKHWLEPDATMTAFNDKGCWYGICTHHAIVHTAILQERAKGGWNIVDGIPLKAVMVRVPGHCTMEIYIKDVGYFIYDVFGNVMYQWKPVGDPGDTMMNRHFCTGGPTSMYGEVPYNREWAGFPRQPLPPPKKSYIKATTTPTNASIWLKKQ